MCIYRRGCVVGVVRVCFRIQVFDMNRQSGYAFTRRDAASEATEREGRRDSRVAAAAEKQQG